MAHFEDSTEKVQVERAETVSPVHDAAEIGPTAPGTSGRGDEPAEKVSWSTILAVFFMGLSFVPSVAGGLLLPSGILSQIGEALGNSEDIVWIPGSWLITSAVSFSVAGGLSDIFGRRYVLISGQILTLVGAIIAATAEKLTTVVAGSAIIGFGGGMTFVAYAGISELLPNKYRGMGIGWTEVAPAAPWGFLSVLMGNLFVLHATWRWCYYLAIIYSGVAIAGTTTFYFPPSRPRNDYDKTRWQEFKELDFIGIGLFAIGITVFLIGITELGANSYSTPLVASTITVGAVVLIGCFAYDFTIPQNPIFPFRLFKMFRKFTVHLLIIFVAGMIWQASTTLAPQATLFIYTNEPLQIGVYQIPSNMSGVVAGTITFFIHKIKHIRYQILFALTTEVVFTACYAAVLPQNKAGWMAIQLFGQFGFIWIISLAYVSSSLHVPQEDLGISAGLIGTFRSVGSSVGNAIFTVILNSIINKQLGSKIAEAALANGFPATGLGTLIPAVIQNAVGVPGILLAVPDITPEVAAAASQALKDAYAHAFRIVFICTVPFGVIALAAAWFVEDPTHLLNNHVAVHQEKEVLSGKRAQE